ncbi:MAG: DUF2804 domain-containing protein [Clostridiales bacterium]|jgi:hypothetical protein|nr:DUF2804 domain-containing protein [Clostridiales bacterium]MDR2751097.1 DUF2804 domain-containing protein [Clostridiales bacterium]
MQREVTRRQKLLDKKGVVAEPGYARKLVWEYNRQQAKKGFMRLKEWDYYLVMGQGFAAAFTISDLSYIGLASVSLLDLKKPQDRTKTFLTVLPLGRTGLSDKPEDGNVRYLRKGASITYEAREGERRIECSLDDMDGEPFKASIALEDKPQDVMCIASTWKEKPTCFYLNQKVNCMRASGEITLGDRTFKLNKETDFGTLDWGRGIWTYDNTWYWGTCSAMAKGKPFGFNLGYGFSDRPHASENMIFFDGKASKLEDVTFEISKGRSGFDYMSPWLVNSSDGRFKGVFTPVLDRKALISLAVIVSDQHQVFGKMSGKCVLDSGEEIEMKELWCAIEHIRNKY